MDLRQIGVGVGVAEDDADQPGAGMRPQHGRNRAGGQEGAVEFLGHPLAQAFGAFEVVAMQDLHAQLAAGRVLTLNLIPELVAQLLASVSRKPSQQPAGRADKRATWL